MQKIGCQVLKRFSSQKFNFKIFPKTNAFSITFGPRYIHGQSLKEIDFPTRNAVDWFLERLPLEKFSLDWGFHHVTSSPGYPQSNGQSERTVQTVKSMLEKADDPYKALLSYRNTPLEDVNLSPSQMLMGRRLRTQIPMTREMLKPQLYDPEEVLPKLKERQRKQQLQHDKTAKELPPLRNGEFVRVQEGNKWKPA